MWIVLENFVQDNRKVARVKCPRCNAEKVLRVKAIRSDTKCRSCNTAERNRSTLGQHQGVGGLTRTFFNYFRNVARRRGVPFALTIEQASAIAESQGNFCALTGLVLEFPKTSAKAFKANAKNKPSLDRIDSTKAYEAGNVQWVHSSVNIMKNGFSQEEFVYFCHLVAQRHANPQPSALKGNRKVGAKVQRLMGEDCRPIIPTRVSSPSPEGDEIVRYSEETRRVQG